MEFYNNKKNDTLKFKINADGIDSSDMEARLILHNRDNKNYIFFGDISGNHCTFDIPELGLYEKEDTGKIKFEIISEDVYFNVWEDKFEIKTKPSIKIEEMVVNVKFNNKKKISASPIIVERVSEKKKEKEKMVERFEPPKVDKSRFDNLKELDIPDDLDNDPREEEVDDFDKNIFGEEEFDDNTDNFNFDTKEEIKEEDDEWFGITEKKKENIVDFNSFFKKKLGY